MVKPWNPSKHGIDRLIEACDILATNLHRHQVLSIQNHSIPDKAVLRKVPENHDPRHDPKRFPYQSRMFQNVESYCRVLKALYLCSPTNDLTGLFHTLIQHASEDSATHPQAGPILRKISDFLFFVYFRPPTGQPHPALWVGDNSPSDYEESKIISQQLKVYSETLRQDLLMVRAYLHGLAPHRINARRKEMESFHDSMITEQELLQRIEDLKNFDTASPQSNTQNKARKVPANYKKAIEFEAEYRKTLEGKKKFFLGVRGFAGWLRAYKQVDVGDVGAFQKWWNGTYKCGK